MNQSFAAGVASAIVFACIACLTPSIGHAEDNSDTPDLPNKWFQKAKGYEQALELQQKTGADIFIYFSRQAPSDEKGLCKWFENKALSDIKIRKYLREYIKVQVPLPSNPDCQRLAETFQIGKTPAVYIVQQKRHPQRCPVFDWSDKKPKLLTADEMISVFRVRSSERYQLPVEETEKQ